ncbi:uncharacterized protein LOC123683857 isoform X2 [Harmonia axyridis]|uniref:uncharacterized protein LOC123683857 isoform X2 n=1 Tax=Harmonia axyridis TaxID=115357 RepID=UPI001E277CE0|nr:uncharacterized protein LOC123683857 isoform X2 [Harmonia axyridis]
MQEKCSIVRISIVLLCVGAVLPASAGELEKLARVQSENDKSDLHGLDGRNASIGDASVVNPSVKQALYDNSEYSSDGSLKNESFPNIYSENELISNVRATTQSGLTADENSEPTEASEGYGYNEHTSRTSESSEEHSESGSTESTSQNDYTKMLETLEATTDDGTNEYTSQNYHTKMLETAEKTTEDRSIQHTSQNDDTKMLETAEETTEAGTTKNTSQNDHTKMLKTTEEITEDDSIEHTSQNVDTKMLETAEETTEAGSTKNTSQNDHTKMLETTEEITEDDSIEHTSQNVDTKMLETAEETTEAGSTKNTSQNDHTKMLETTEEITEDDSIEHTSQNDDTKMLETAEETTVAGSIENTSQNENTKMLETLGATTEDGYTEYTSQNYHTKMLETADETTEAGSTKNTSQDDYTKRLETFEATTDDVYTEYTSQKMLETAEETTEDGSTEPASQINISKTSTEGSNTDFTSQDQTEISEPTGSTAGDGNTKNNHVEILEFAEAIAAGENIEYTSQNYEAKMSETTGPSTEGPNTKYTSQNDIKTSEPAEPTTEGGNTEYSVQKYLQEISKPPEVTTEDGSTGNISQNDYTKVSEPDSPTTETGNKYTSQNDYTKVLKTFEVSTEAGSTKNTPQNEYPKTSEPARPTTQGGNTDYTVQKYPSKTPKSTTESGKTENTPQNDYTKVSEPDSPITESGFTGYNSQNDRTKMSKASEVTTEGGDTKFTFQNPTKTSETARPTTKGVDTHYTTQKYSTEIPRTSEVTTEYGRTENTFPYTKRPMPNGVTEKVAPNVDFRIKNVTSTSFVLEWEEPEEKEDLLKYHIVIKKKKSHYINNQCYRYQKFKFTKEYNETFFKFTNASPNHLYEVKIVAEYDNSNSTGIIKQVMTKSSKSTQPLNVKLTVNTHNVCYPDLQSYNVTLELKWELPCNTNGELVKFVIDTSEIVDIGDETYKPTGNKWKFTVPRNGNIRNETYGLVVGNLNASCHYDVTVVPITTNHALGVAAHELSERTKAGCPMEPREISSNTSSDNFVLHWMEPVPFRGKILDYNVIILKSSPKHPIPNSTDCPKNLNLSNYKHTTEFTYFNFDQAQPNFIYFYEISARTSAGTGKSSGRKHVSTQPKESEPIRHLTIKVEETIKYEKYENKIQIKFKEPCNTNGMFLYYNIEITGTRYGYPTTSYQITKTERTGTIHDHILREPEYFFNISITAVTEDHTSPTVSSVIRTKAAIPTVNEKKINYFMDENSPTSMKIVLDKELFSNKTGNVSNYAIFLYERVTSGSIPKEPSFGSWNQTCSGVDNTTYPSIRADKIYRVTDLKWNPFSGGNKVSVFFGKKETCPTNNFCRPLKEKTNYIIVVRGFTKNTCRDVFISFETGVSTSSVGLYLVLIFLLVLILLLGVYIHTKRTKFLAMFRSIPDASVEEAVPRHLVAVKNFKAYYNKLQNDPTILRKQYEEIDDETKKYKEECVKSTFALKPENKRKNRYTNILPYDEYRVKLNIDEDDEISSDYINASYIRGVSGEVEYIATQGPLEHTCKDFWKMVIQENIVVIVMVSQFIEKEKEKCFKYFPNNHENMMICEDLEVKCLTELQFDTYCVRTLLVRKDLKRLSVVHMQYLDWPDFGCPSGTYKMLSFCEEVRERIQLEKGLMAVHCSAGVGRTGTLISLDILLQTMRRKKEISVFECVMDLRKQRTHMVQTEKQYVYIHTCLKDVLENSSLYSFDETKNTEGHVYQNITNERVRSKRGTQCEESESVF